VSQNNIGHYFSIIDYVLTILSRSSNQA